jgi:aspartyl-tRNA(Asn)/glutamyl-tRNA(Gln) amidotransferase subunit C
MAIGIDEVEYVAGLARLALSEKDKELFSNQLSAILEYVAKLNELDTRGTPQIMHGAVFVFRG